MKTKDDENRFFKNKNSQTSHENFLIHLKLMRVKITKTCQIIKRQFHITILPMTTGAGGTAVGNSPTSTGVGSTVGVLIVSCSGLIAIVAGLI